jgi:phenylalanyl-tRNA synthetase beta chain
LDSAVNVLSIPPIINSDMTKIDSSVTDLFVDVTGTDPKAATIALNVIATTLHDLGGKVCSIQVRDGKKSVTVPDLTPTTGRVNLKVASQLLGIKLTPEDTRKFLEKARVGVRQTSKSILKAVIPCYRFDILHPVDLVEEICIGYGVDRLEPSLPPSESIGQLSPRRKLPDCIREICIGSGLQQTTTYALLPKDLAMLFSKRDDSSLSVEETRSLGHEVLRASLFPGLLLVLSLNIHQQYPQRIFEIGDVFEARREEGLVEEKLMLGVAVAHSETDFSEIKSYLQSIFLQLGIDATAVSTVAEDYPAFAGGRSARISLGEDAIGKIGEISPSILRQMSLRMPTTAFEVDLRSLIPTFKKQQE